MSGRTVLVCGSRGFPRSVMVEELPRLTAGATHLIHGDCRGPDRWSEELLDVTEVTRVPADWSAHGKAAGFVRNGQMVDMRPDLVIAFWDGRSRGTENTIALARKAGLRVIVVSPEASEAGIPEAERTS